jgi:hypothetical protein
MDTIESKKEVKITGKKEEDLLNTIRDRYKTSVDGWNEIYEDAKADIQFVYDIGEGQWPTTIRSKREKARRPVLTINKLLKFVRQIRGDHLQNRPRIKTIPVDSKSDPAIATLYDDLIRQIEYLSDAHIAYDTAYGHAIAGSIGFFRLITRWSQNNPFEQDIFIKRIVNPFMVHFDPSATEFNYEDARWCFIEDSISKKEFERKYPDADTKNFDTSRRSDSNDWFSEDRVRLAEYFWKEPYTRKMALLSDGSHVQLGNNSEAKIKKDGLQIIKERNVESHRVMWCKTNGYEILEHGEWPGKYIPVIPVLGDEIVIDGKKYYLSLIRGAKDPQRMYNYWSTSATETVALTPKSPFIIDKRQIDGFETEWEESNEENRMYIRYNAIAGLQKPSREPQAQIPAAIISMMQTTAYDIEDHLGRYEASKGAPSNERSGRAILARVEQSDRGTFQFIDNLTRAITYCGKQLVDLIPKIYDSERALRIMDESGNQKFVAVNTPVQKSDGSIGTINDLSVGQYDVIASVGLSYGSKREEMVRMLRESMQYAPNLAPAIAPLIFKYTDYPGAEEVYQEIKKATENMKKQEAEDGGIRT